MIRKKTKNQNRRRRGATAVEFAMVSPIIFLVVFACFEFGRLLFIEAFVEQAAFEAARNVAVVGARKSEGIAIAERELSIIGINESDVSVSALVRGVEQAEIDGSTEQISVTVAVDASGFLFPGVQDLSRTAIVETERFEY